MPSSVLTVNLTGQTFVVTGGTGVLGSAMAEALAASGAHVAILCRDISRAAPVLERIGKTKGKGIAVAADVLDRTRVEQAAQEVIRTFSRVDGLVNAAGGNHPLATTGPDRTFFQLEDEGLKFAADLNLLGTIIPCQVFGQLMSDRKSGVILNVTSMAADRPLTRVPAYSAAKAAVSNFTQWLAVHMAQEYSPAIRVNAIAPGFFLTEQNKFLLREKGTGELTERGKKIMQHTPMQRFGEPSDLAGAVLWLLSPASQFVTGIVVPVDGGFSAFSGV